MSEKRRPGTDSSTKTAGSQSVKRLPHSIVSDNGSCFTSDEFEQFCRANGIKYVRCSPYHPSSNGAAERAVQIVKFYLLKTKGNLEDTLYTLLARYRVTPRVQQEEHLRSSCSKHRHRPALICYHHQYRTKCSRNKRTINSGMTRMLPHALS